MNKMIRALVFLDDLAELVLVGLARGVRARWRMLALLLAVGGGLFAWSQKPAPIKLAPRLDVAEIRKTAPGIHSALVNYGGRPMQVVSVGDVLPDGKHPELVIASIDCHGVNAVRVGEASVVRRLTPSAHASRLPMVSAVAGDSPNFVAVTEYLGQTYIIQRGTRIPDDANAELTVTQVFSHGFEYYDHVEKSRRIVTLEPDSQTAPTPEELAGPAVNTKSATTTTSGDIDGLDLEGI